ncbi:pyrrolysine--tRNA(Pyl) ligase large subunit [Sporomusa acidovorans]|uniref:Aminoacyl-transfer RNA synthetases class-II family profile domain-containing protein n=1 Tax=Sporomusa acidovorans (strain ATCC 49682 / DSM 3132 / Mol) TaxID=1123286 RepID=A0ABZ3IWF6_SPOA4|nr:pyrrolysine--tRNA(Pyl) ligase large subunit [Sporomusa acidovorans]OZC24034.1 pyrrolysine--tRNA ligase [Sporomusa acidovorans DSM 3132]SDF58435.1 Pyrrolysyl-tRNA synthetase [Sporomusa acidovorans]
MAVTWTEIQRKRLMELNATETQRQMTFATAKERDEDFKRQESILIGAAKLRLEHLRSEKKRPSLSLLASKLVTALNNNGFVQVTTPIILAKSLLAKMTIDEEHELFSQVFWLDDKKCLRPMLAPNLYYISKDLMRLWEKPVRIFEIGSCFRKESQGNNHLNEFTMLNLVEWGLPEETRHERLAELAAIVMQAAAIDGYRIEQTSSVVYGDTLDVMAGDIELGSGAMGPHFLDGKWGIVSTWVGIGFGLERLVMVKEGGQNVRSTGKSLSYLDGVRLNI